MLRLIISLTMCATLTVAMAKVERVSFYFKKSSVELTMESSQALSEFEGLMDKKDIQLIEINGFSENSNKTISVQEAKSRVERLLSAWKVNTSSIAIKHKGHAKVRLNFDPTNWDRVDVYYNVDGKKNKRDRYKRAEELARIAKLNEEYKRKRMQQGEEEGAFVLTNVEAIFFVGGTDDMIIGSDLYMEDVKQKLDEDPNLVAHIRGHVCCGNKVRLSKKRAKKVYKSLVEMGVDKDRLSFRGYGNTEPIVYPEVTFRDRNLNRCVDVVYTTEAELDELAAH